MSYFKRGVIAVSMLLVAGTTLAEPGANRVDERQARQSARIEKGVASGALTQQEAERLKRGQERVQKAETRAMADGNVSDKEKRRIERMQDHQSRAIARQAHDRQRDANHDGKNDRRQRAAATR